MLVIKYKICTSHISGVPSLNFCDFFWKSCTKISREFLHTNLVCSQYMANTKQKKHMYSKLLSQAPTLLAPKLIRNALEQIRQNPYHHPKLWRLGQTKQCGNSGGTYSVDWYVLDLMS